MLKLSLSWFKSYFSISALHLFTCYFSCSFCSLNFSPSVSLLLLGLIPSSLKFLSARRCIATLTHGRGSPSREGMASDMLISKSFYRNTHVLFSLLRSFRVIHLVSFSQPCTQFKPNEKLSLTKLFSEFRLNKTSAFLSFRKLRRWCFWSSSLTFHLL